MPPATAAATAAIVAGYNSPDKSRDQSAGKSDEYVEVTLTPKKKRRLTPMTADDVEQHHRVSAKPSHAGGQSHKTTIAERVDMFTRKAAESTQLQKESNELQREQGDKLIAVLESLVGVVGKGMMEGSKGKRKHEARRESGESASEASEARQDAKKAPKESGSRRGKTLGPSKTRVTRQSK